MQTTPKNIDAQLHAIAAAGTMLGTGGYGLIVFAVLPVFFDSHEPRWKSAFAGIFALVISILIARLLVELAYKNDPTGTTVQKYDYYRKLTSKYLLVVTVIFSVLLMFFIYKTTFSLTSFQAFSGKLTTKT